MIENDLEPIIGKTVSDAFWGGEPNDGKDSLIFLAFDDGSRLVIACDLQRYPDPLRVVPDLRSYLRTPEEVDHDAQVQRDTPAEGPGMGDDFRQEAGDAAAAG